MWPARAGVLAGTPAVLRWRPEPPCRPAPAGWSVRRWPATVAPVARPLPRMLSWRRDGRHEPPGLTGSHLREWRRVGLRGLTHLVRVHLRDRIEEGVPDLSVPLLVLRGCEDRLTTFPLGEWNRPCRALRSLRRAARRAHLPVGTPGRVERAVRRLALEVAAAAEPEPGADRR